MTRRGVVSGRGRAQWPGAVRRGAMMRGELVVREGRARRPGALAVGGVVVHEARAGRPIAVRGEGVVRAVRGQRAGAERGAPSPSRTTRPSLGRNRSAAP